ncbi:MAG: cysteine hydrolase [Selenomonadales bacterium]|nr:cysteine hydrolase [Selenomonadales bacterium]
MRGDKLVIIDMQNVYEDGAPWGCEGFGDVCERIAYLIERGTFDDICFTRFVLPDAEQGSWRRYREKYMDIHTEPSYGEITERLSPFARKYRAFDKAGYSAYRADGFAEWARHADRLVVCGVIAECCVLATVLEAADRGADIVYLTDACASTSKGKLRMAEVILREDFAPHVTLMTTDDYLQRNKKD